MIVRPVNVRDYGAEWRILLTQAHIVTVEAAPAFVPSPCTVKSNSHTDETKVPLASSRSQLQPPDDVPPPCLAPPPLAPLRKLVSTHNIHQNRSKSLSRSPHQMSYCAPFKSSDSTPNELPHLVATRLLPRSQLISSQPSQSGSDTIASSSD